MRAQSARSRRGLMRRDEIWRWMLRVVVTGSLLRMTPGAIGMMGIRKKAKTGGADCENGGGFWCCTKSYKVRRMKEKGYAVLIADVVGSRTREDLRALLGQRLEMASRAHLRGK